MRPVRLAAALALAAGCVVLGPVSASAEDVPVPGSMSTAAVNTTRFDVPVPAGVVPRAITGVLTMPEVVNNGVITFRVNGRIARTLPSTLYAKVRIPVTAADVVANGTIGLSMSSQGPAIGGVCRPAAGEASLRKIALSYRGTEQAPTSLANFFPPTSNRIDVLIAPDADDDLLEAGIARGRGADQPLPRGHRDRARHGCGRAGLRRGHPARRGAGRRTARRGDDRHLGGTRRRSGPDDRRQRRGPRCRRSGARAHRRRRHPPAGQRPRGGRHQRRAGLSGAGSRAVPGRGRRRSGGAVRLRDHLPGRDDPAGRLLLACRRSSRCTSRAPTVR